MTGKNRFIISPEEMCRLLTSAYEREMLLSMYGDSKIVKVRQSHDVSREFIIYWEPKNPPTPKDIMSDKRNTNR